MAFSFSSQASGSDSSIADAEISDVSLWVARSKRIVVVTGAGISCSSGIPDFRSSDGLYALVKEKYPDVVRKGRDLFNISVFRDTTSTSAFYNFISQLKQVIDRASPSASHRFIRTLDAKKKLLRLYTQNIDGLEDRVGLAGSSSQQDKAMVQEKKSKGNSRDVRSVQLHGDIHRLHCMICSAEYGWTDEYVSLFDQGRAPDCPECSNRCQKRIARSARRISVGTLRPAIVLYDEPHPRDEDIGLIQCADMDSKPDMLIIMGTSLKVIGVKKLVQDFARVVHSDDTSSPHIEKHKRLGKVIFVNRTPPGPNWDGIIDCHISGETDVWADRVVKDWKKMRPADWRMQPALINSNRDVDMSGDQQLKRDNATNVPIKRDPKSDLKLYADSSPPKKRGALPPDHRANDRHDCRLLFANSKSRHDAEDDDMGIELVAPVTTPSLKARIVHGSTPLRRTRSRTQKSVKPYASPVKLAQKPMKGRSGRA